MHTRRDIVILLSALCLAAQPGIALAKDGDRDDDNSGSGGGSDDRDDRDDRDDDRSGRDDDRDDRDDDRSGRDDDRDDDRSGSGGSSSGSGSGGSGGSSQRNRGHGSNRGEGQARPPGRIDTASVLYRDGRREAVRGGRYEQRDATGRLRESRRATRDDLRRIINPGNGSDLTVRMDSRSGAAEIIDRRGWREVLANGRYMLTDPRGRIVRERALRGDDLVRLRALIGN